MEITLDGFVAATQTVVIDPADVVVGADLRVNAPETSPGCMSFHGDADCMAVMAKLGLGYGDEPAADQALIRAR
jgi:hypothetical protein